MDNQAKKEKIIHFALGTLLLLLAINAFGGGFYGLSGAKDVPAEWLQGSPFDSYFIPSLMLIICVGGSALFAAILVIKKHPLARKAAIGAAMIVLGWIIAQLLIIGYVSWLQPTIAIWGICILLLAAKIPKHVH
jgi:uncharacterized BrkB/YihY/UPF0761 family membrane protein